jgi:hypothetical protein
MHAGGTIENLDLGQAAKARYCAHVLHNDATVRTNRRSWLILRHMWKIGGLVIEVRHISI